MGIIITYDIPSKHIEFKNSMFKLDYKDQVCGSDHKAIYFPNTTLYHDTKTAVMARDESKQVCKQLQIELERCIATIWSNWSAIYGEQFN